MSLSTYSINWSSVWSPSCVTPSLPSSSWLSPCPWAIPLAMITRIKSTHGFPFLSYIIWVLVLHLAALQRSFGQSQLRCKVYFLINDIWVIDQPCRMRSRWLEIGQVLCLHISYGPRWSWGPLKGKKQKQKKKEKNEANIQPSWLNKL